MSSSLGEKTRKKKMSTLPKLPANTCCVMWCQRLGSCRLKAAHHHLIPLSSSVILLFCKSYLACVKMAVKQTEKPIKCWSTLAGMPDIDPKHRHLSCVWKYKIYFSTLFHLFSNWILSDLLCFFYYFFTGKFTPKVDYYLFFLSCKRKQIIFMHEKGHHLPYFILISW